MNSLTNKSIQFFIIIFALVTFRCAKDDAGFSRTNPFDSGGKNWNPPSVNIGIIISITEYGDTASVNINDSLILIATAMDNGKIEKYIWAPTGNAYYDTTVSGTLKVAFSDSGRHVVWVKVVDDDGVVSEADSCVVKVTLDPPVVKAMADTSININDSLTVIATATDNGKVLKYFWSCTGVAYSDTTDLGKLKIAFSDSGRHVVRVKVVDDDGVVSEADSCVVKVTLDPPVVKAMADTSININDSITVVATATDNGKVTKYYWSRTGSVYSDTTVSGMFKVAFSDSGRHIILVKVIDDDGVVSTVDSCVVRVLLDAPLVTMHRDTAVSFGTTLSITVSVMATDVNVGGSIVKYYWDIGINGWDDSTSTNSYTVKTTNGGAVVVRWGARDDDGVMSFDTFTVIFNRPPVSATLIAPISSESWTSFNWSTGKGSLPVILMASDPDGTLDTLTYSLYTGASTGSLSLSYSGRVGTATLRDVDSSSTVYYHLVAHDLFGDSVVSSGTLIAPLPLAGLLDYEGNYYPMEKIGSQTWIRVNLRSTKYNDGSAIPQVTSVDEWAALGTPGYCFYENDTAVAENEKWGALYNWYAINTGKLAPAGWHVPTTADWDTLANYLGGFTVAGSKLKETGTVNWTSANTGATNESGFTALPGGSRSGNGVFDGRTNYGYWWSAQVIDVANARGLDLGSFYEYMGRFNCSKKFGFSVRLVKDR